MKKPFVIGIAGGSASGKSTFADNLAKKLYGIKTLSLHMDSYFKPEEERQLIKAPVTGIEYLDDNHPSSFDLSKLNYDLEEAISNRQFDVVIVEGLLTLWDDDVCAKLNLRLFADCQADERIVRRLKRNMKWGLTFDQISDVYLDLVRYRHNEYVEPSKWRADFILNGSNYSDKALDIIVAYIRSVL